MHTACPVHMASAEKIAECSLSAKTHSASRPELPKQASCVKQVPANISGGLVWGIPTAICLSLLRDLESSAGQERAASYGTFLLRTQLLSLSRVFLRPGSPL